MTNIYVIVNKINNHFYLGRSENPSKRFKQHLNSLRKNKHHSKYLQRAFNKYGESNFSLIILEQNVNEEREQFWLDFYFSESKELLYNVSSTASGGNVLKGDLEAQKKKSEKIKSTKANQDLFHPIKGQTYEEFHGVIKALRIKERISNFAKTRIGNKNPFFGKSHSDEFKRKQSENKKGSIPWNKGKSTDGRSIKINNKTYKSISEASRDKKLNLTYSQIKWRLNSKKYKNFSYI